MGRRRLPLVAVILVLLAACTPEDPPGQTPTPDSDAAAETESKELPVIHDFGVVGAAPDTTLSSVDAPVIEVGKGKAAILAIKRPSMPARCLIAAQLRLYLQKQSDLVDEELAVYPSHVFDATKKRDGDDFGYSGTALDIRPRATLDEPPSRWSQWDVTDIVRLWLSHGAFPSRGLRAPKRGPIVLTLRDVDGAKPFATATFLSADARDKRPHLVVTRTKGCASA